MSKIFNKESVIQDVQFQVIMLDQSYLVEAVNLLNHTFCNENPVWKHFVQDQAQTREYVTEITRQSIKNKMLYGVVGKKDNFIRSIILYLDIVDYIEMGKMFKQKYGHLKLINQLGLYSQMLEGELKSRTFQRGQTSWGFMVSTHSNFFKSKYGKLLLSIVLIDLRDRGYKVSYGRSSNALSRIGMQKMGGKVIKTVKIKGTDLQFNLMQNTHQNFKFDDSIKSNWEQVGFLPKL